jgi:hypothetical protein
VETKHLGRGTKIQEHKFQKSRNKNYKNLETKITKIREQKLQKSGNKNYKKSRNKVTKIGNKNPGTKVKKNLGTKIQE